MPRDSEMEAALAAIDRGDATRAACVEPSPRIVTTCAADVAPQTVDWLWHGWLPFGKLVSFDGAPGIGKSTLATDLIARASRGGPMPNEDRTFAPVRTMIAGVEDGWADTVRPRLDAAGANLSNVHFLTMVKTGASFTIPGDVEEVGTHALALGAQWLHLDSIMGVLDSSTDAYKDHDVRRALGPLKDLAERHGLVVTFVRHPRKTGGNAVNAGGGSIAFTALARVGLFVGLDPSDHTEDQNDRRRVLAAGKSNLARMPQALAFAMVPSPLGGAAVSWRGLSNVSADELASPIMLHTAREDRHSSREARGKERAFLREMLAHGARVALDDIKAEGVGVRGLSWRTIERAADDEGVSKERRREFRGGSEWYLPQVDDTGLLSDATDPPAFPPLPPLPTPPANSGATGGNGAPRGGNGASAKVGRVRVTLYDGAQLELAANDRDLTELRDFITLIEPLADAA